MDHTLSIQFPRLWLYQVIKQISIQTYTKGDINMGGTKLWFSVTIKQKIPFKYLAVKVV